MSARDEKTIFSNLIRLIGKQVEVGVAASGEKLRGQVSNAMFDSFILCTESGKRIIRFDDILFLDEISNSAQY